MGRPVATWSSIFIDNAGFGRTEDLTFGDRLIAGVVVSQRNFCMAGGRMSMTSGLIDWDAEGRCGPVAGRNVVVEATECVALLIFNIGHVEFVTCT